MIAGLSTYKTNGSHLVQTLSGDLPVPPIPVTGNPRQRLFYPVLIRSHRGCWLDLDLGSTGIPLGMARNLTRSERTLDFQSLVSIGILRLGHDIPCLVKRLAAKFWGVCRRSFAQV